MKRSVGILVPLIVSILLAGCNAFNPARDYIPIPPRPQWCKYTAKNVKGGVFLSVDDSDTLTSNIATLKLFCDELEIADYIHNGEPLPKRLKGRK